MGVCFRREDNFHFSLVNGDDDYDDCVLWLRSFKEL